MEGLYPNPGDIREHGLDSFLKGLLTVVYTSVLSSGPGDASTPELGTAAGRLDALSGGTNGNVNLRFYGLVALEQGSLRNPKPRLQHPKSEPFFQT